MGFKDIIVQRILKSVKKKKMSEFTRKHLEWLLAENLLKDRDICQTPRLPAKGNVSQLPMETETRIRVNRINRYLDHQFKRLKKYEDNPEFY